MLVEPRFTIGQAVVYVTPPPETFFVAAVVAIRVVQAPVHFPPLAHSIVYTLSDGEQKKEAELDPYDGSVGR